MRLRNPKRFTALITLAALVWVGVAWASDTTPSFQEKEAPPVVKHQRHFPWLWIAAGAVATGVLVYLLVKKAPEYKLKVDLDDSASGSPGAGVTAYKKGQTASYDFAARPGFDELTVLLDGVKVKSSGSFKMVRDHALKVSARPITFTLTVDMGAGVTGTPPSGTSTRAYHESVPYSYAAADGYQNLKVLLNGTDVSAQGTLLMDRDHSLSGTTVLIQPPTPLVEGILWNFTFVSSKRGTINAVLVFNKIPEYPDGNRGTVTAIGGNWDTNRTGIFKTWSSDNSIEIYFFVGCNGNCIDLFNGYIPHADLFDVNLHHMSGVFRRLYGDPPRSGDDYGTWSADRL